MENLVNMEYLNLLKVYKKMGGEDAYEKTNSFELYEMRKKVTAMERSISSAEIIATIKYLHTPKRTNDQTGTK